MGQLIFLFLCGSFIGAVIGFYLGYILAEKNVSDKISSFASDVYMDSMQFKNDVKREIRELRDDLKK